MRDSSPAPLTDALAAVALEARWRCVAAATVLPMVLAGWLRAAVLAFGLLEVGLATAKRRDLLRRLPWRATVPVEARQLS